MRKIPIALKGFVIFILLIPVNISFAQLFTTTTGLPVDLDVGTNYTSCAAPGTKAFSFTVSGVGILNTTTNQLFEINIRLDATAGANLTNISCYIKSPSGTCIQVAATMGTTSNYNVPPINRLDYTFRNAQCCLNSAPDYSAFPATVSATSNANGRYGIFSTVGDISTGFNGQNADGVWVIYFAETVATAPAVTNATIEFGNLTCTDQSGNGNNCVNAIVWTGESICATTQGMTGSTNMPCWNGSGFSGACPWNNANNNDVWIEFTATSTSTCFSLSSLVDNLQSIVVTDPNTDGDNNACTGANGTYWTIISCPDDIYTAVTGTARNQNHCFTSTPGVTYYLVVDGNGGAESPFYISGTSCPVPIATAIPNIICPGESSTLTATGMTTYSWMPGSLTGATVTVSPATTTTYTVTGISGGCTETDTVTVTVSPSLTITATATPSTICPGGSSTLTASGASTYAWMPGSLSGTTVTVSPVTTTTYTITGTTGSCTGTTTVTVTVNPSISVSATASPPTVCPGSSSTLTASGASTYSWMPGSLSGASVTVTPATATTYTVTGTSGGCSGTATVSVTVNPALNVTATASPTTVCPGDNSTLTASGATTYTWMPGSLSGTSVTVTPVTATIYTVTGTTSGCTGSGTVSVTMNPSLTVTATASPTTVCPGDNSTLTASGATTYTWMPGSLSGTSVAVTPVTTTIYTVTGTTSGCTGSGTVSVTMNPSLNVTATAAPATICPGGSSTLTGAGATLYTWMPGSLSGTSVSVTPTTTTTYTVTGTTGGCSGTATVTVTISSSITVTASATPATVCPGDNATLTAFGGSTYNWIPGSLPGASVTVSPTVTTTYTVTGNSGGCTGTATVSITVNSFLNVTAAAAPAMICPGGSSTLTANGATSYTWMPDNLPGTTITVSPLSATTYTVTGITGGCTGNATVTVDIDVNPGISATASPASICSGQSAVLTGSGAISYVWIPGNLMGTTVNVSPTANTVYTVTGTSAGGCTGSATVAVSLLADASLSFTSIPREGCVPLTVQFHYAYDGTIDTNSLQWNFGDPATLSDVSNLVSPVYTYTDDGSFVVSLSGLSVSGCTTMGYDTVKVLPTPIADFLADPWVTDTYYPLVHFYDESVNGNEWQWSFGDAYNNFSSEQFPYHTYGEPGKYEVMQIVSNGECSDTIIKYITILEGFTFYIPNTFTPNDNGLNETFKGMGIGFKTDDFELHIFDRWGKEVFYTADPENGWDGKVNGKGDICMNGIYGYLFKVVELNEIKHQYTGIVLLLR